MIKSKSKTIKEYTYTVQQVGCELGSELLLKLGSATAGGFSNYASGKNPLGALSSDDFKLFCKTFAATTTVTGGELGDRTPLLSSIYNMHFAGRYMDLLIWLGFCIEVNFESFLTDLAALLKDPEGLAKEFSFLQGITGPSSGLPEKGTGA